jgi:hypothetical protein
MAALSVFLTVFSQIESPIAPFSLSTKATLAAPTVVNLKAQAPNVAALVAQDANSTKENYRVGVVMPHTATLEGHFSGTMLEEGTLYRLEATSPGALGMGVNFRTFQLPEGATMHMYTPDHSKVRGAYTTANHKH